MTTTSPPSAPAPEERLIHLRSAGVSIVVDARGERLPRLVHWGADLGPQSQADLDALVEVSRAPAVSNTLDVVEPVAIVPEPSGGWFGIPGIAGHIGGRGFAPRFAVHAVGMHSAAAGGRIEIQAADVDLALGLCIDLELTAEGILRARAGLTNNGAGLFDLHALRLALPIPTTATEVLDFTGRHLRERIPQRHTLTSGAYVRTGRRGRTGSDATLLLAAGTPGFGFRHGAVWAVHTAWSGDHTTYVERDSLGTVVLGGGEELLPGEIRLGPGESYQSPELYAVYGDGLDELSGRLHDHLRARPQHPRSPRPVTLNTWEAVYFTHDLERLTRLADRAAAVGVERFVLDDGWFGGRRDETAGLGDWHVSAEVWPDGLTPLVDHVRGLGMEFGLWFEPEMINPDSETARQHPEWIMSGGTRTPPASRHQQVLDLANPAAFEYILTSMDALISEYRLDFIKWDHNRDLVDGGHPLTGRPGVHDQTLAAYRLMDELKARHPGLEIESCSSGGARIDLGVLQRTDRVWTSDCIDPLERQHIQRWTGLLLPPELLGAHVGAATSHTTGRTHPLPFRAATALFGHFGIEWDLEAADDDQLADLASWVALHRELRALLHGGRTVHADLADPAVWLSGVVAPEGDEAIYAITQLGSTIWAPPGRVQLPGLDPARRYRVTRLVPPGATASGPASAPTPWLADGVELSGSVLSTVGVQAPALMPESTELLRVVAVGNSSVVVTADPDGGT